MLDLLYPYAVALVGVLGLMSLWLVVQRAWGRAFLVQDDVLAARDACDGCTLAAHCTKTTLIDITAAPTPDKAG